jgi:hypothetical protein
LDRSQFEGIEATQDKIKARVEQRITEVQGFRDMLRELKNEERMEKAQQTGRARPVRAGKLAATALKKTVDSVLSAARIADKPAASVFRMFGAAGKLADGLFELIDPPLTPAMKREKEIMARTREAEAETTAELVKYAAERRRQEEGRHIKEDRGRER